MGSTTEADYDAIVIGAGFAGLRSLYELQTLGLSAKGFEAGSDVGGTWYWNRYPGARTDSEAWVYIMNFSKELNADWNWSEKLPGQDEVKRYLSHVADRFKLREKIDFNTRITSAKYNDDRNVWTVTTAKGQSYTSTFLVSAVGPLSAERKPPFPGLDTFQGKWYQTSSWPKEGVDLVGKRVAVVGTGATGVQVIPIVAHEAKTLTVFQRHPNYVIPGRNHTISKEQLNEIRRNYDDVYSKARDHVFGLSYSPAGRTVADVKDEAEYQRILEWGWETGGFRFVFETFDDVLLDPKSNEGMAEFVRNKIRTIVKDPKTAELLSPKYPFLAKRPPLGHFYYEAYNRPNVKLVDVSNNPIQEITPKGIRTGTDEYEFDIIIFAIGFDAATGALTDTDIRGKNNESLSEKWDKSLETFLGIAVEGFPNFFMVSGPQSPFANIPMIINNTVTWIGKAISYLREHGQGKIEVTNAAPPKWAGHVEGVFKSTLLATASAEVGAWYVGANVPGKPQNVLFYFGGVASYFTECEKEVAEGFPNFKKS